MSKKEVVKKMKRFGCMGTNCKHETSHLIFYYVQKTRIGFNYEVLPILIDELRKCVLLCVNCCKKPHLIHRNIEYCETFLLEKNYSIKQTNATRYQKRRLEIRESRRKIFKLSKQHPHLKYYRCTRCYHFTTKRKHCDFKTKKCC